MSDYTRQVRQDLDLGAAEAPIVVPPSLSAQAVRLNRFSIVGVLVNPEKQSMKRLITVMPCVWGLPDVVIGRMIDSRTFQFVFPTEESLLRVLRSGPWSFADWMIVSRRWDAGVSLDDLKVVQFWVQIQGIPPHYLSRAIIDFIGNTFGEVVAIDFQDHTNLTDYVWVLVNWNIDNPLRFKRKYQFSAGEVSMLTFRYDRLVNFCSLCGMLTHDEKECPLHTKDDKLEVFTKSFPETGFSGGISAEVPTPHPYVPPIDSDKLAETLHYLKEKLAKEKFTVGQRLSSTNAISPNGWVVGEGSKHAYQPMERGSPENIHDDYIDTSLTIGAVGGAKRKREGNDKDISAVVMHRGSKKEIEHGVLEKQWVLPNSDGNSAKVGDTFTYVSNVVMEPEIKLEEIDSVYSPK